MDWKQALAQFAEQNPQLQTTTQEPTPHKAEQRKTQTEPIRIELDKRKGKIATLITNIQADNQAVKDLAKELKTKFAVGGAVRDNEILLQGDLRQQVANYLKTLHYPIKRINF